MLKASVDPERTTSAIATRMAPVKHSVTVATTFSTFVRCVQRTVQLVSTTKTVMAQSGMDSIVSHAPTPPSGSTTRHQEAATRQQVVRVRIATLPVRLANTVPIVSFRAIPDRVNHAPPYHWDSFSPPTEVCSTIVRLLNARRRIHCTVLSVTETARVPSAAPDSLSSTQKVRLFAILQSPACCGHCFIVSWSLLTCLCVCSNCR